MEAWIPITVLAAFSQNIRSALQKRLTRELSTAGATQARFVFAIPFTAVYLYVMCGPLGFTLPDFNPVFLGYAFAGGMLQIAGTAFLVALFAERNFVVGATFSKTEAIQTALLGIVVLGDRITPGAIIGICIGLVGVVIISSARDEYTLRKIVASLGSKAAIYGTLSGMGFGLSAICFRGASLSLEGGVWVQAAFTLMTVVCIQTLVGGVYLAIREPGQNRAILRSWPIAWLVGLTGMIASAGWFTAVTLQAAGYVRALGQVEIVFAFLVSVFVFKEKVTPLELLGIAVMLAGILLLLLNQ